MGLESHIQELSVKHRALDRQIQEETAKPSSDDIRIAELKRQKLNLKDRMTRLQSGFRNSA